MANDVVILASSADDEPALLAEVDAFANAHRPGTPWPFVIARASNRRWVEVRPRSATELVLRPLKTRIRRLAVAAVTKPRPRIALS
jgi:hypothetical protein